MNKRYVYLLLALATGILGYVLSILTAQMPFFAANYGPALLLACSVYLFVAFAICKKPVLHAGIALAVALALEFSQLLSFSWLNIASSTAPGAYILGNAFSISDVFCTLGGIAACFIADFIISARKPKVRKSKYRK